MASISHGHFLVRRSRLRLVPLRRCTSSLNQMRKSFRYDPLDIEANEIRVLTIEAVKKDASEQLHCSLSHQPLSSRLEYHGLSYAWRDNSLADNFSSDELGEEIVVNDSRMFVGQNLAAALRARRLHEFRSTPLWIDALCINQEDTKERNSQVLRMGEIYAQASLVTVWLGPERDNSAKALALIRWICEMSAKSEGWTREASSDVWIKDSSEFSNILKDDLVARDHTEEWQAVHSFLRRAWWKRMWIVQETVVARRILFFCGPQTLDPMHVARFFDILAGHAATYMPLLSQIEGIVLDYDTFSLARAYLRPSTWNNMPLLSALYRTGMALSTDPRDKIYSVLNLAYDGAKIVPSPDYSVSVEEVNKKLVISIVQKTKRLDVLSLASLPVYPRKLDMQFPSWVPDWTYRVTSTINSRIAAVSPVWADGSSRAVARFTDDGNTLIARGLVVDAVDGLARCGHGIEGAVPCPDLHQSNSRQSAYTGLGAINAIWRSLLANRVPLGTTHSEQLDSTNEVSDILSLFIQQCRYLSKKPLQEPLSSSHIPITFANWYHHNKGLFVGRRTINDWVNDPSFAGKIVMSEPVSFDYAFDFFDFSLGSHLQSWRFLTTMGGYVGLGPNTSQPGDKIVILLGCATPLILRNVQGHYELVGECYVHGIMHGEAMQDSLRTACEMVDLKIK